MTHSMWGGRKSRMTLFVTGQLFKKTILGEELVCMYVCVVDKENMSVF